VDASIACQPSIDVIPRTERLARAPRIALYKPWTASMDEGWTRWVLEQFGVPFARRFLSDWSNRLRLCRAGRGRPRRASPAHRRAGGLM
jgi:hypothetical protein